MNWKKRLDMAWIPFTLYIQMKEFRFEVRICFPSFARSLIFKEILKFQGKLKFESVFL